MLLGCDTHTQLVHGLKDKAKEPTHGVLQVKDNKTYEFDNTAAWRYDSYYSMGILGFGLFVLLGITSLPSVSNSLNWREFCFVQVLHCQSVEMHTFECQ